MALIWKDISSYSRGDTERTPRTYQLQLPFHVIITVTRHRDYPSNQWLILIPIFNVEYPSDFSNISDAQNEAIELARQGLTGVLDALKEST